LAASVGAQRFGMMIADATMRIAIASLSVKPFERSFAFLPTFTVMPAAGSAYRFVKT
jgi:hypothetical protein